MKNLTLDYAGSDIQCLVVALPIIIGVLFILVQFFLLHVLRFRREAWFDAGPYRFWFVMALFNYLFAGIWSDHDISFNTATILLAFVIYLAHKVNRPEYYSISRSII